MLAKTDVLILDDWGLAPFSEENRRDLLEIVEDRHDRRATIKGSGQIRAKIYAKLEPFPVQEGTRELREVFHTVLRIPWG